MKKIVQHHDEMGFICIDWKSICGARTLSKPCRSLRISAGLHAQVIIVHCAHKIHAFSHPAAHMEAENNKYWLTKQAGSALCGIRIQMGSGRNINQRRPVAAS